MENSLLEANILIIACLLIAIEFSNGFNDFANLVWVIHQA
jgi:hypothetical protein